MSSSPVQHAHDLAREGRVDAAVARLQAAGAQGDSVALAELAAWYLRGDMVPRDFGRARAALRAAVAIGHVDAALMEIALTANGTGAPADWAAARQLLDRAATKDPVAAQQRATLAGMTIDDGGRPTTLPVAERLGTFPDIVRLPAFITAEERQAIANAAIDILEPAMILNPTTGATEANPIRTSDGASIGPTRENLVVRALNARAAAASGTAIEQGEPLSVLRYQPRQQYRAHLDTLPGAANQRLWTMLMYLNDGFVGGETVFPAIGLSITPRAGDAILFRNLRPDGSPDPLTRHASLPVVRGTKWLATRWIRVAPVDPWSM